MDSSPIASPRTYNTGFMDRICGMPPAVARYPWPADCGIQGGGDGIVIEQGAFTDALTDTGKAVDLVAGALGAPVPCKHYRTAFFEAFPQSPSTFIRSEGKTLEEAEDSAWRQYERILACTQHEFDRGSYRTGAGICRKCGLFSSTAFETTLHPCVVCGRDDNRASHGTDKHDRWHCKECHAKIPEDEKSEIHKMTDRMRATMDRMSARALTERKNAPVLRGWSPEKFEPDVPNDEVTSWVGPFLVSNGFHAAVARFDWLPGTYTPRGWYVFKPAKIRPAEITCWRTIPKEVYNDLRNRRGVSLRRLLWPLLGGSRRSKKLQMSKAISMIAGMAPASGV
jgi:hypothetical protein